MGKRCIDQTTQSKRSSSHKLLWGTKWTQHFPSLFLSSISYVLFLPLSLCVCLSIYFKLETHSHNNKKEKNYMIEFHLAVKDNDCDCWNSMSDGQQQNFKWTACILLQKHYKLQCLIIYMVAHIISRLRVVMTCFSRVCEHLMLPLLLINWCCGCCVHFALRLSNMTGAFTNVVAFECAFLCIFVYASDRER